MTKKHGPWTVTVILWLCLQPFELLAGPSAAPEPAEPAESAKPGASALSEREQVRLAERFAPVLVFHREEDYFPSSPLFPLEDSDGRASGTDRQALLDRLGTPASRRDGYRALTLQEKSDLTTVYYRAYPARYAGESVIVLEYWTYYVYNDYRVRANILPVWAAGVHPNDLEHIHLILRPQSAGASNDEQTSPSVEVLYASAHEGSVPANRYIYGGSGPLGPMHFLVERGSHALAPDVDSDGLFTPRIDGDSGQKVLWGIRDSGLTWARYSQSYMDDRAEGNSLVFHYKQAVENFENGSGSSSPQTLSYRLVPVQELVDSLAALNLSDSEREQAFESHVHWFKRAFGGNNGRSRDLLAPAPANVGGKSIGVESASRASRSMMLGTVLNHDAPGLFGGLRYLFHFGSAYIPDPIIQVDGIATTETRYVTATTQLSYPLDSFTRILTGPAISTDSARFDRVQWGWTGTIEVRLGRMRISASSRANGPIVTTAKEFRLFYAF